MVDLWPDDIAAPAFRMPVTILKEQAALLGRKTHNIVTAEVENRTLRDTFRYRFWVVAPALDDYSYELFTISYGIDGYPVEFSLDNDIHAGITHEVPENEYPNTVKAKTEEEFINVLRAVLQSEKTRRVIGAILAQSEGGVYASPTGGAADANEEDLPF